MTFVAVVQLSSAIGTFLAAGVGLLAARAARDAARAGNDQAQAAQAQVELARRSALSASFSAQETLRARLDTRAPVVFVVVNRPHNDLNVLRDSSLLEKLLGAESISTSRSFDHIEVDPEEGDETIVWFQGTGIVVNEGELTALVSSEHRLDFAGSNSLQSDYLGMSVVVPRRMEADDQAWYVLPPRSTAVFKWAVGKSVRSWVAYSNGATQDVVIRVVARGASDIGVFDNFETIIHGCPIEPIEEGGVWLRAEDWIEKLGLVSRPPKREYRIDANDRS